MLHAWLVHPLNDPVRIVGLAFTEHLGKFQTVRSTYMPKAMACFRFDPLLQYFCLHTLEEDRLLPRLRGSLQGESTGFTVVDCVVSSALDIFKFHTEHKRHSPTTPLPRLFEQYCFQSTRLHHFLQPSLQHDMWARTGGSFKRERRSSNCIRSLNPLQSAKRRTRSGEGQRQIEPSSNEAWLRRVFEIPFAHSAYCGLLSLGDLARSSAFPLPM